MPSGTIDISLRPIKLAFLIDPTDKKTLLEIIQINSFLWGGVHNPIIPIFKRKPIFWDDTNKFNMQHVLDGYIDAYNPDIVVSATNKSNGLKIEHRSLISLHGMLQANSEHDHPGYGIDLFTVLIEFYRKTGQFVQKNPQILTIPTFEKKNQLFLASVFGMLFPNINSLLKKGFDATLEIKRPIYDLKDFIDYYSDAVNLFPLKIGDYGLETKYLNRPAGILSRATRSLQQPPR